MLKYIHYLIIIKSILSNLIPLCKEGENFCSKCNPQKKLCIKCDNDLLIPDNKGGCTLIKKCISGKNNCMECSEEGNLCKVCQNEYYPDENGGCSYTDNCIISKEGRCLLCKENYILIGVDNYFSNGIKICKSLNSDDLKYCERINMDNGACLKCKEGFYLGNEDKKCTIIRNCVESIHEICQKCNTGYYLNKKENKCLKENDIFNNCMESIDGQTCYKCNIRYYFDDFGKCSEVNYCSYINKVGICKQCKNEYYLTKNRNSCTFEKNCFSGNKDFGICELCDEGYYLDLIDRKCKSNQNDDEFKYCKKAEKVCEQCIYGYQISGDHKCSTSYNCDESNNGICIKCIDGYHLGLDNKCNNIDHCMYLGFYGECKECEENYFFDRQNKTCLIAEDNFKNCRAGYQGYYCQECRTDFYLNQTDHLCYNNTENIHLYKCAIISSPGDICLECVEGYYLGEKDNKCSKIYGCALSENENFCLECNVNYCLDVKNGKCKYNNNIYNEDEKIYYRCNRTNEEGTACEICVDNYTLSENGLCVNNEHCIEKKDGICQKCLIDKNNTFCLNNLFGCVNVYNKGCLLCNNILDFYNCTKCLDGFENDHNFNCVEIEE